MEHQETVRSLLESIIEDIRQWRGLDRELVTLEARIKALESSLETVVRDAKECRMALQSKLNGLSDQYGEGRVAALETRAKDRDEWRKEMKTLEDRIQRLERDSAVVASKYGIIAAILSFVAAEVIRWLIRYAHG